MEESGAREEIAECWQVGKGGDSRLRLPSGEKFGFMEACTQFLERAFAEHHGKEDSLRTQGAPALQKRSGQIIDMMEVQDAGDEVELFLLERKGFLVCGEGFVFGCLRRDCRGDVAGEEVANAFSGPGVFEACASGSDFEGFWESSVQGPDSISDFSAGVLVEGGLEAVLPCERLAMRFDALCVEDLRNAHGYRVMRRWMSLSFRLPIVPTKSVPPST